VHRTQQELPIDTIATTATGEGSGIFTAYPELWGQRLCLDFVNSRETDPRGTGQTHDRLPMPGWQAAFLALWKLALDDPAEPVPIAAMVELRTAVRDLLERWAAGKALAAGDLQMLRTVIGLAPVTRDLSAGQHGYEIEVRPFARNWNWVLAEIAVSVVDLIAEGHPERLKGCSNPDCSWLFYDDSQNRTRRWCSARACGNLLKVRRFRARHKRHV
jgi:predicted RNA-binding Zn ribbon-like protein